MTDKPSNSERMKANKIFITIRKKPGGKEAISQVLKRNMKLVSSWNYIPGVHVCRFISAYENKEISSIMNQFDSNVIMGKEFLAQELIKTLKPDDASVDTISRKFNVSRDYVKKWKKVPKRHLDKFLCEFSHLINDKNILL